MKTVAVLGASTDRSKFGNKAVRGYARQGYVVWPVNPRESSVEDIPAFASIGAVPGRPQIVSVYLPPPVLLKTLPDIAAKGCDELWLNPGTDTAETVEAAEKLGLNVIRACSIIGIGLSPASL
jgi:predicted CoA-binding protein